MTSDTPTNQNPADDPRQSSVPGLTRKEFLKKVMLSSAALSAPVVLDKFLVRPAAAMSPIKQTAPGKPPPRNMA